MLEIFPKLSGLDGLEVTNLRKKDNSSSKISNIELNKIPNKSKFE